MACATVEGAVSSDAGNLLIERDLLEQFEQDARLTNVAGGDLGGADFQC